MKQLTKSMLEALVKEEVLEVSGVQTRKVFTEKYTMAQRRKDLMNNIFISVMKEYNKYAQ